MPKTISITAESDKASTGSETFQGERPWDYDLAQAPPWPSDYKALIIPYESVCFSNILPVEDFDIKLSASVEPTTLLPEQTSAFWSLATSVGSGGFDQTNDFNAKFQNPKLGGLYKFQFKLMNGTPLSEANLLLPLAGAEVKNIFLDELKKADVICAQIRSKWLQFPKIYYDMYYHQFAYGESDHRGYPNNQTSQTSRRYQNVDNAGGGGVATWFGVPILTAKMNNVFAAYILKKIDLNATVLQKIRDDKSGRAGTPDDASATASWDAGIALASGTNIDVDYYTIIPVITSDIWSLSSPKNRLFWPNYATPDNYRSWSSIPVPKNFEKWFNSPRFLERQP